MRAIAVQWSAQQITIHVYTDGNSTSKSREAFDAAVVTQMVADFPDSERGDPKIGFEFVRCDAPASSRWVPYRAEHR